MENFEKRVNVFFYTKRNRHAINKRQKTNNFPNNMMTTVNDFGSHGGK